MDDFERHVCRSCIVLIQELLGALEKFIEIAIYRKYNKQLFFHSYM